MKVKLTKAASWNGDKYRSGSVHDLNDKIANKLIDRGYAKPHTGKDVSEDASTAE